MHPDFRDLKMFKKMYFVNRIDEICSFFPPGCVEISLFEKKLKLAGGH